MSLFKVACGLAVALALSGCGGGSPSSSTSAADSSSQSSSTVSSTGSSSGTSTTTSTSTGSTGSGSGSGATPPITGSATVSWSAPTTNTDGSALTNLSGYRVYYGTNSGALSQEVDISSPSTMQYVISGLTAGTWYFAVASLTNDGEQSALSATVSKTIS